MRNGTSEFIEVWLVSSSELSLNSIKTLTYGVFVVKEETFSEAKRKNLFSVLILIWTLRGHKISLINILKWFKKKFAEHTKE